jgi:hypothetical protein
MHLPVNGSTAIYSGARLLGTKRSWSALMLVISNMRFLIQVIYFLTKWELTWGQKKSFLMWVDSSHLMDQ